jgi:hypothetical protein
MGRLGASRPAAACTEIAAVDALWQDFAIIRREPNTASPNIAREQVRYSRDPGGPAQPLQARQAQVSPMKSNLGISICLKRYLISVV